ncbi:hypothetical protein [Bacillus sp. REN3]|uniref:hypothetical protein n=1 Tax=Bacillus sp. REN3 TaxID=2802440 RepID=UPI001AEF2991|nr:hypothetical protein [Bacillus sp. REN3]
MYAQGSITPEQEAEIPVFKSHDEAREWFKKRYGQAFQMVESENVDGRKCFIYYLVLDKDTFWKGQKELADGGTTSNALKYLGSFQAIHIFEDGSIFITQ